MKYIFRLLFALALITSCSKGTSDQKALFICLEKGQAIGKLIKESNTKKLSRVFDNVPNVDYLIEILEDNTMKHEKYVLNGPNIFYNPYGDEYIYTIFASKWIDNNTEWGLNDYLFVLQLAFKYDEVSKKVSVEKNRVLKDHAGFKTWWYSFMRSYKEKSCRRKVWADLYGIVPPPPPPPVVEDWISNTNKN
ncbi:hypothetical protein [uncultured Aquimarina sp.]|uniref:hypothetical protein n=1 Tax=uncultured Aquimarina sp. TaxID=575652 RepID=UPI0026103678|nr:hypothetical protein [uncultured Aquimarina sp.]